MFVAAAGVVPTLVCDNDDAGIACGGGGCGGSAGRVVGGEEGETVVPGRREGEVGCGER